MKLSLESIKNIENWNGYHLPEYNPVVIAKHTRKKPQWAHFGCGNIFRIFPGALCQRLIEQGDMDTGILCCEGYDEEIITRCFRPCDNLTVGVTMNADGSLDKEIIASLAESLTMQQDLTRIREIFAQSSLQMVSFTITEKGYALRGADHELMPAVAEDMQSGPEHCRTFMAQLTALCIHRGRTCGKPLALVSMDNCSRNGEKLQNAVMEIAKAWLENGRIESADYRYLELQVAFPWSMIDKITPRPDEKVEARLQEDGLEEMHPFVTAKHTYIAPFVNAEKAQYLVIEDWFPNGRPPLEKAGVIITSRETVNQVEKMKVSTCLNPLHTCLAIYGCLLGYQSIAAEMQDPELSAFVTRMGYEEGMLFVVNPGVIDPQQFLEEVLQQRLPNPFMPDTPQRIATDTSQKLSVRFGETIRSYMASPDHNASELKLIPLVLAGWLRYLLGIDDAGKPFTLSPDPLLPALQEKLTGIGLGSTICENQLKEILSDASIFGVDLYACGLAETVLGYLRELAAGPGAVRRTLQKYVNH